MISNYSSPIIQNGNLFPENEMIRILPDQKHFYAAKTFRVFGKNNSTIVIREKQQKLNMAQYTKYKIINVTISRFLLFFKKKANISITFIEPIPIEITTGGDKLLNQRITTYLPKTITNKDNIIEHNPHRE